MLLTINSTYDLRSTQHSTTSVKAQLDEATQLRGHSYETSDLSTHVPPALTGVLRSFR